MGTIFFIRQYFRIFQHSIQTVFKTVIGNFAGILQRSVRGVESECFARTDKAFFHMKPRGSLTATVLTKGITQPDGSANLEFSHQANRKGILPSERGVIFQQ